MAPCAHTTFRAATPEDLDTVVHLLCELVDELGPADVADRIKPRLAEDIRAALASDKVRIVLAWVNDDIAGLSRGDILCTDPIFRLRDDPRCGYIDQMFVRPAFRGQSLGKALLAQCEDWFRELGIAHAILHAAPRALRFYAREGYLPNREMFKRL